ncbi:DUF6126 family protein [Kitasatospora sp. NPDC058965]|uniref:DUF6126 family protein n=1 Tax=Kitasatospora sp. NPDC058965 TaxID=3346682 RepID=UPI00368D280D
MATTAPHPPRYAQSTDGGKRTDRRVAVRVFVYMAAAHVFGGFLYLLFWLGAQRH